jgi:hypothetical protein
MTAPAAMTEHLTDNELAALVEHGPRGVDRSVVEHVADCGECREALIMASDVKQQMEMEHNVEHGEFGRGRGAWKVFASAAALAAALFVVFGGPLRERWFGPKGTEALAEASKGVELRATAGRLSGFPYQRWQTMRGGDAEDEDLSFWKIEPVAVKVLRDPEADPHATGVAYLIRKANVNDRANFGGSIPFLEKALATAKPEERSAVVNDLAVALIASGSDADLARALTLLEEQWRKEQTPEIAFNRATVLYHQNRDKEAVAAWDDYLRLDSTSEWAVEARKNRDTLLQLNPELRSP